MSRIFFYAYVRFFLTTVLCNDREHAVQISPLPPLAMINSGKTDKWTASEKVATLLFFRKKMLKCDECFFFRAMLSLNRGSGGYPCCFAVFWHRKKCSRRCRAPKVHFSIATRFYTLRDESSRFIPWGVGGISFLLMLARGARSADVCDQARLYS